MDNLPKNIIPNIPSGHNFIVWLSHDVDRVNKTLFHSLYYGLKERRMHHFCSIFAKINPYWDFEWIMKTELKYGVRSTFFFLNETMKVDWLRPKTVFFADVFRYKINDPNIVAMIKRLDREGWEIGMHGSFYSYKDQRLLREEKQVLEGILGHSVHGTRQHALNLDIPGTWKMQKNVGFHYDTSFGHTGRIGYKDGMFYPYRPFNDDFVEFPLAIMDTALFREYKLQSEAKEACLEIIKLAESKRTILTILWHQRVFTPGEFPGLPELYEFIIQECQKRKALFCTGKDIFNFIK